MPNDEQFDTYVEALTELGDVDNKQRRALRNAVEASAAADDRAKTQLANQQRMYDRAKRDALDAERALDNLRSTLKLPCGAPPAVTIGASVPRSLVQIRAQIAETAQWASASKATAESLMRSRDRLARAPQPVEPKASRPAQVSPAPRRPISVGFVVAIVAMMATVVVIVLLVVQ